MVTDLAGEPVDGVTVRIGEFELGTVDPSVGTTSGGTVQATLLTTDSGSGSVGVEAGGERWGSTMAFALLQSASSYSLEGQYRVVLNPDDDGPIAPGPLSVTLGARSCFGMSGAWRGVIYIEAGPYLSLIQAAGAVTTGLGMSLQDPAVAAISVLGALTSPSELIEGTPSIAGIPVEFIESAFGPMQGIDPASAIPVPVTLYLPPAGGPVQLEIGGLIGSDFAGKYDGRRSLVQLSANGIHLLTARIRPEESCDPFELDQSYNEFLDVFEKWIDELSADVP
ncbi:MAG: hypothetical protein P1T08_06835 [Acidimicrobiia bacterium]|nr:hypothetical protein [Acidimicrobiia bacterium]